MPVSELRLIKRCAELIPKAKRGNIPANTRGIYVLFRRRRRPERYNVVYIGMAGGPRGSIRRRINRHASSEKKASLWTHFSIFEVWDNIREEEIKELEGLFRHIYRSDTRANRLNVQRSYKKLKKVRVDLEDWKYREI